MSQCAQAMTLAKHVKFSEDSTKSSKVTATSCFMANH